MRVGRNNRRLQQWQRAQARQDATGPSRVMPGYVRALRRDASRRTNLMVHRWIREGWLLP